MADPTTNGVTRPDDPDPKSNRAKLNRFTKNPGKGYAPSSGAWYGYASALIDGAPIFTWLDVPRMLRDPQVQFGLRMLRAPFGKTEFDVRANSQGVSDFVTHTINRFWRRVVPKLLLKYFSWGYAAAIFEYSADNRQVRWRSGSVVEPRDAHPEVWRSGARAGQFAGFTLTAGQGGPVGISGSLGNDGLCEKVLAPHAMWFAGHEELGRLYDRPRIAGAFEPWLEKRGRNGAVHSRRLWYRKCAFSGGTAYYPLGTTDIGTADVPDVRMNQDIMREVVEKMENGGAMFLPSLFDGESGKRLWEFEDPKTRSDVGGVLDYPKELDREILIGLGIPPEVIEASEVGSGWSGRMIPAEAYLGSADELSGMLLHGFDESALRELVRHNFGSRARYEVEAKPLGETLVAKQQGGPGGQMPPGAQIPGGQPGGAPGGGGPGGGDGGDLAKLFGDHPPAGGGGGKSAIPYDGPRGGHWLKDLRTGKLRHRGNLSFEESKIEREQSAHDGKRPGEFAPKSGGGTWRSPHANDPVHDYLSDFNNPDLPPPTAKDARDVNQELRTAGSRFRMVPEEGKWAARHVADLNHEYGEGWAIATHPLTGRPEIAYREYFDELRKLAGDRYSQGYLHAFNDPNAPKATQDEADDANKELETDGSKYRIKYDPDWKLWVAAPANGKANGKANLSHEYGDKPAGLDQEHAAALYYALLATAEHGQQSGANPDHTQHALDAIADLAAHPDDLGRLLHSADLAHWVPFTTRRQTQGALNPDTGRKLYGQRAYAALEGHAKRTAREASSARARELLRQVYFGEAQGPEHFAELADHLPSLTVDQLKSARTYLGQQFPDAKRRDALVSSIVGYAQQEAERRSTTPQDEWGAPPGQAAADQEQARRDAEQAKRDTAKGVPANPKPGRVYSVPTSELHVDPARFQYKISGIGAKGVTDELKDVTYDPQLAGVIHVWKDPANGQVNVVNGHHRHERADAAGVSHQNVMFIDAKNAEEARAVGAMVNIAEGKGTAVDAAKFFRDTGTGPEDLKKRNVPVKGAIARDGAVLAKLADPLFTKLANGRLEPDRALAIAQNLGHDPEGQVKLLHHIEQQEDRTGKDVPARVVAQAAQDYATAPTQTKTENTLFGTTEEEESLFLTKAELKTWLKGQLVRHAADFKAVSSERRAGTVAGAGNVLNVEANKAEAGKAAGLVEDFDRAARTRGKVADIIDRYTKEYANAGKSKDAVKSRLLAEVRAALAAPDGGAEEPADRPAPEAAQPADGTAGAEPGEVDSPDRKPGWATGDKQLDIFGTAHNIPRPSPKADQQSLIPREIERKDEAEQLQAGMEKMRDAARDADAAADAKTGNVADDTLARAKANYPHFRDQYLAKHGSRDADGNLTGVVLNTDDWRDLFPEYTGTNATDVHEASSHLNKQLFAESLKTMQGKGNGRMLVLAGGGGSGKGTATRDYFDQQQYPIVLDQASDNYPKLEAKLDEAKAAGFTPEYTFIDRGPAEAWDGVVSRALGLHARGGLPRTVPLSVAFRANIESRKAALELLKRRPDVDVSVIDNTAGKPGARRMLTDRAEAIGFLEKRVAEDDDKVAGGLQHRLEGDVVRRHLAGEIPEHIAVGLIGADAIKNAKLAANLPSEGDHERSVPGQQAVSADDAAGAVGPAATDDRLAQPGRAAGAEAVGSSAGPGTAGTAGGAGSQGQGRSVDDYVTQAMTNLRKTSRTAGGVVDTSASKGKAEKIAEGLTPEAAAKAANDNFERAVRDVHDFATTGNGAWKNAHESARTQFGGLTAFMDGLNQDINEGITKEGVLLRTDNSTKFPYTDVQHLPLAREQFAKEFLNRLRDRNADPVETAAWVEWRMNLTDHPYADGVGKTSKALAMIPLMRAGLPLPEYPDNKEFFKHGPTHRYNPNDGSESYLDKDWERFRDFYKTLMPADAAAQSESPEGASNEQADRLESQGGAGGQGGVLPGPVGGPAPSAREGQLPADGGGVAGPGATGSVLQGANPLGEGELREPGAERDGAGVSEGNRAGATVQRPDGSTAGGDAGGRGGSVSGGRGTGRVSISDPTPTEKVKAAPPSPKNPTDTSTGSDFAYDTRDFAYAGPKQKFRWNIEALRTLRKLQEEGREVATPAEQAVLSKFIGWGQFGQTVFNPNAEPGKWKEEQDELRAILGEKGYEDAKASVNNSHYTDPSIVDAHWKIAQRLGFNGGRHLETSAGIGYYLGMMPKEMRDKVNTTAVEKDSGPAGMLKLLYPNADVREGGIEDQKLPKGYYDLVASNVPFGKYGVYDPVHSHMKANIHDYFFLKSADHVRDGGLIQHITSLWTMDKVDPSIRKKLADTCDLVAAIRFPAEAHKGGAGTSVATDMVILRKRKPGEAPGDQSWLETTQIPDPMGGDPITVNKYFADHPEQVLGRIDRSGKMFSGDTVSVSPVPDYEQRLADAIERLPENIITPVKTPADRLSPRHLPQPGQAKKGSLHVKEGKVFVNGDEGLVEKTGFTPEQLTRLQGHLDVRDAMRACLNKQREGLDAGAARANLHKVYDAFVAKHGLIHDKKNLAVFADDPDSDGLLALEVYDKKTKKATKADIFSKDVVRSGAIVRSAKNAKDALGVSLHETGAVDVDRMAEITGLPKEQIEEELHSEGLAYPEPTGGWKPRNEYLSGNVRAKLTEARAAAQNDPKFKRNVEALEKVQPEDVPFADITVKMGVPWVPTDDIAKFAAHVMGEGASPDDFKIERDPASGKWYASYTSAGARKHQHSEQANEVLGTFSAADREESGSYRERKVRYKGDHGVNFMDVLRAGLGSGLIKVMKEVDGPDGKPREVVDKEATEAANEKVSALKEKFNDWIWTDPERRDRLSRYYNDNFNNIVEMDRAGSGAHQTFPGLNPSFKPHAHIPDFVWQIVSKGRGVAAHEVGMGKTAAMVMGAMELRRLGLARKPAIACLKANIETITKEAQHLYPGARILSTAGMYDAKKRRAIMAKIATGDYDLVVMTHDHLDKMKMSTKTQQEFIREELKELEETLQKAQEQSENPDRDPNVKRIETAKKNLEVKLKEAIEDKDKDDALGFEESGIDHLFVDEAHYYKTLPCYSQMGTVKGISQGRSDRATEMQMRTRWLLRQNRGRGVVFATGTPVTNTMGELFNIQRFIQPDLLKARGLERFDDWAKTFGDTQTKTEYTVTGEYKPITRFSKFVNMPELKQMAVQDLDVQRVDDSEVAKTIKRPKMNAQAIVAKPSKMLLAFIDKLKRRAEEMAGKPPEKGGDNMLSICTDGKKASIDMRLVDRNAPDDPGSKTNLMVGNVLAKHKERPDQVQLIFSDLGVHPVKNGFHLYKDIIDKLVAGGIPREKIADFSTLDKDAKEEAMAKMRRGEIVVALGGTKRLGTGVNVQDRVMAIHHLDVPDRPDMLEQRNGRGYRYGNLNTNLDVHNYVTERSLDQTFWTRVANKEKFIKQALDKKDKTRVMEEVDSAELSPDLMVAVAAGDDRIMRQYDLKREVAEMERSKKRHELEQTSHQQTAERTKAKLGEHERTIAKAAQLLKDAGEPETEEGAEAAKPKFSMRIGDVTYGEKDRKEADDAFKAALQRSYDRIRANPHRYEDGDEIATFRGLTIKQENRWDPGVRMMVPSTYLEDSKGNQLKFYGGDVTALNMAIASVRRMKKTAEADLAKAKATHETVSGLIGKPFPRQSEYEAKKKELADLDADLQKKKPAKPEAAGDAGEPFQFDEPEFIERTDEPEPKEDDEEA